MDLHMEREIDGGGKTKEAHEWNIQITFIDPLYLFQHHSSQSAAPESAWL